MCEELASPQPAGLAHSRESFPLLALPAELLHHVLGMLEHFELPKLLGASKFLAQHVMQHSSGRFTMRVPLGHSSVNLAAVSKVLRWAPPACLMLHLRGETQDMRVTFWEDVGLFATPTRDQQTPQFPSILQVTLSGFVLPGLVPAGLAAACPNLHTLSLYCTRLKGGSTETSTLHLSFNSLTNNNESDGSNTGSIENAAAGALPSSTVVSISDHTSTRDTGNAPSTRTEAFALWRAKQLKTLELTGVCAPSGWEQLLPAGDSRMQETSQQYESYVAWLRSTVPSITCLKLHRVFGLYRDAECFIALLAPQLQELHVAELRALSLGFPKEVARLLQQLHKLVLPCAGIQSDADMEQLLSLPSLTHLELDFVLKLQQDYSCRPCKWQYLKLHLGGWGPLCLESLAKLPLHSLTDSVELCNSSLDTVKVLLPCEPTASLHFSLDKLKNPGVQLLAKGLVWKARQTVDNARPLGALMVPDLMLVGPVFGQKAYAYVGLSGVIVDQEIVQALAAVHGSNVRVLTLDNVTITADMMPTWKAALSAWPQLTDINISGSFIEDEVECLAQAISSLVAVVSQEPSGRHIAMMLTQHWCHSSSRLMQFVLQNAEDLLGVTVTIGSDHGKGYDHITYIRITAGHSAVLSSSPDSMYSDED